MDLLGLYHCFMGQSWFRTSACNESHQERRGRGEFLGFSGSQVAEYQARKGARLETLLGLRRVDQVQEGSGICGPLHILLFSM